MLVDPNTGDERTFTFDYSFWSHDGFRTDENGIFVPTSPKYADQNVVYEALGKQVLDNAWEGYNCCLFAYGQTGSGKSYSMVSPPLLLAFMRNQIADRESIILMIGEDHNVTNYAIYLMRVCV